MLNPDDRLARLQSVKQRHECHANSVVQKRGDSNQDTPKGWKKGG
jgi:hypothetical protein